MARYTFGGDIHDLIARPDANAGGALKLAPNIVVSFFSVPTGGTVLTDFIVDSNGDGSFETSDTSVKSLATGYLPDFQGPDGVDVLYYDPDPSDADVRRVRYVARDSATGGIPNASTTAAGIVEYADAAELATGTATNRVTSVADVTSRIAAHANAANAHPDLTSAIDSVQAALEGKADLTPGTLKVSLDDLPASTSPTPDSLPIRKPVTGAVTGGIAIVDEDLVRLDQTRSLIAQSAAVGTTVLTPSYSPGTPPSSVSATTFTAIPTIVITGAKSGETYRCEYDLFYRGSTAGGIQVRFVAPGATVTNRATNPSIDSPVNVAGDGYNNAAAITRSQDTTTGQAGANSMKLSITGAGTALNPPLWTDWVTYTPGEVISVGLFIKRNGATVARNARLDLEWGDATGDNTLNTGRIGSVQGTSTAVGTTFGQLKIENQTHATAVKVRIKLTPLAVAQGDAFNVDAVQIEPGATLPAFGSTGSSGAGSLTVTGEWGPGLTNAATTSDNYSKITPVRQATSQAAMTTAHGALGTTTDAKLAGSFDITVSATGLINQTIQLEFAQRVVDASNPTTLVGARSTMVRLA